MPHSPRTRIGLLSACVFALAFALSVPPPIPAPSTIRGDVNAFLRDLRQSRGWVLDQHSQQSSQIAIDSLFPTSASIDEEIQKSTAGSTNSSPCEAAALGILKVIQQRRVHANPLYESNVLHSPISFLNRFAAGFCDDAATAFVELALRHNIPARTVWIKKVPDGNVVHVVAEAYCDRNWGIYDPDIFGTIPNQYGRPSSFEEMAVLARQGKFDWAPHPIARAPNEDGPTSDANRRAVDEDPWMVLLPGERRIFFQDLFFITSDGRYPRDGWHSFAEVQSHYGKALANYARIIPLNSFELDLNDYFPFVAVFIRFPNERPTGAISINHDGNEERIDLSQFNEIDYQGARYLDLSLFFAAPREFPIFALRLELAKHVATSDLQLISVHTYSKLNSQIPPNTSTTAGHS